MKQAGKQSILLVSLCICASSLIAAAATKPTTAAATPAPDSALASAVSDPARTPRFVARDRFRHPAEELAFFGLKPNMTVVEVWPGSGYWTEILGPYLKSSGHYYAAVTVRGESKEEDKTTAAWRARVEQQKDHFGTITITGLGKGHYEVAPPGSADLIVTFRNLHNWLTDGTAEAAFRAFYRALKPGGVLGIVDHRADPARPREVSMKSGYVREDEAVALALRAGFRLAARSEVNANPRDTKDYPEGVWSLPPTYRLKDQDRAKYQAIGESDRFTLKFVKPAGGK